MFFSIGVKSSGFSLDSVPPGFPIIVPSRSTNTNCLLPAIGKGSPERTDPVSA